MNICFKNILFNASKNSKEVLYCGNEFPENTKYGGLTDPQNFLPMKISPSSANDTAHLAFLDHNTILEQYQGENVS